MKIGQGRVTLAIRKRKPDSSCAPFSVRPRRALERSTAQVGPSAPQFWAGEIMASSMVRALGHQFLVFVQVECYIQALYDSSD